MQKQIKPAVYDSLHILKSPLVLLNVEPNHLRKLKQTLLLFKGFCWQTCTGGPCLSSVPLGLCTPKRQKRLPREPQLGWT